MAKKNVKTNLLVHSEAKVRLLGEYLKRYLSVICNDGYTTRIKIYDMFCGEGLYDNGGIGSPLVIMNAVKDRHFMNVAKSVSVTKIDCYFNDIEENKVEKVKKIIKERSLHYTEFGEIDFNSGDYQTEIKKLISKLPQLKLNKEKAFIFIDPYEYKHIKASHIKHLLSDRNAEVLLWLPTQFMYRFSKNGTPEALKDFIEELVEIESWKESDSVWSFITQLKEGFQLYLGADFFVDSFTIQKDQNTVFCLFFFCSHIKGFEKMLEAKWEIDTEQGKGWVYSGNQPTLFHDQKTNILEDKLHLFLNKKTRFNGELYVFTLKNGFLPKHINEILYNWQNVSKIEVLTSNGEKVRKRSFYINYSDYKNDNQKVIFKLN